MKHVSFLFASLLLLLPQSAFAQTDEEPPAAPEEVAEPEPEVSDEPEPEVSDEPEGEGEGEGEEPPQVSEVPEVVPPTEGGSALGGQQPQGRATPVTTPAQQSAMTEPAVEDAAAEVTEGEGGEGQTAQQRRRRRAVGPDGEPVEEQDTADRLAQANPNSGLPWALPINFTQQLGIGTYSKRYDLTNNPTYTWALSAIPRYNLDNGLSLGLRVPMNIEWTDSDLAAGQRYVWWGDLQFDATYTLPWKPGGTMIIPSGLLSIGTSPISRGARRWVGPGGRLLFIKPIPILGGLILGGGASYTYWAGQHRGGVAPRGRVRGDTDEFPCQLAVPPGSTQGTLTTGNSAGCEFVPGTNTPIRHVVSAGLFGTLIPAAGWQINLSFTAIWNKSDGFDESCVDTLSGLVCLGDNSPNNHWGQITSFAFSFGYDVTSYMTLTLGYSTLAFHPDSEGGRENMFFNELSQVNLALQFRVDGMVVALQNMAHEAEEAAGEEEASNAAPRATAF